MEMGPWSVQTPELFQEEVACANDVVLCVKEFWSSAELAQPPFVILPAGFVDRLECDGPKFILPRNVLSDRQVQEFRKTAETVGAEPWRMHRAAGYLHAWLDRNLAQRWPVPPAHGWVMEEHDELRVLGLDFSMEWVRFAPQPPATVTVKRRMMKKGKNEAFPQSIQNMELELPLDDNPLEEPAKGRGRGRGGGRGGRCLKRPALCGIGCAKCRYSGGCRTCKKGRHEVCAG